MWTDLEQELHVLACQNAIDDAEEGPQQVCMVPSRLACQRSCRVTRQRSQTEEDLTFLSGVPLTVQRTQTRGKVSVLMAGDHAEEGLVNLQRHSLGQRTNADVEKSGAGLCVLACQDALDYTAERSATDLHGILEAGRLGHAGF